MVGGGGSRKAMQGVGVEWDGRSSWRVVGGQMLKERVLWNQERDVGGGDRLGRGGVLGELLDGVNLMTKRQMEGEIAIGRERRGRE